MCGQAPGGHGLGWASFKSYSHREAWIQRALPDALTRDLFTAAPAESPAETYNYLLKIKNSLIL